MGRQGNKPVLGSRCVALLGQLRGVTHEEVEAANTCLDRTKPVPKIKLLLDTWCQFLSRLWVLRTLFLLQARV